MLPLLRLAAVLILALTASARAQLNSQEQALANLLIRASGQQRPSVQVDPILSRVARARAMDLARRNYFSHTNPDGHGANFLVRQAGYALPSTYSQAPSGNNIESLAAGDTSASSAWSSWMASSGHKQHLLGQSAFYAEQTSLGVGYFFDANSDYQHYWVVITAPPPGPSLTITSPAANAGLKVDEAVVSGATAGSPAAARVVYRLENSAGIGAFQNAVGTTAWNGVVTGLVPGPNTVRVRSLDAAGGTIKELTRSFRYVVLSSLVVAVEGTGSVTAGFLGTTSRELGARYTLTARAPAGWLFDRWEGTFESETPAISFTMQAGTMLTAVFRVNPLYTLKGGYTGLVSSESATHATSGLLKLTMGVSGAFSGRLSLGGKAYAFSGKFDETGLAEVSIKRTKLPTLTLALQLDLTNGTREITGSVTDGTFMASVAADQAPPVTTRHFAAGRYTVSLPANPEDTAPEYPRGAGWSSLVVSASGVATLAGTLADGRPFTAASVVSTSGELPLYVPLLGGTGSLAGTATFNPATGVLAGDALWTKPERARDRFLPAAFSTRIGVAGSRYIAPVAGTPALDVSTSAENSALQLAGGDLASQVRQLATLLPTNVVAIPNPQLTKLKVTITPATGRFSGHFTHPATNTLSRINGVILQDRNVAAGFFLGQSASGTASFVPMQ